MMRRILLILLLFSLFGCAGLSYREGDVKVTLSALQLLDMTLMEQRYLFTLRVQNRTQRPLKLNGMSFDVDLNGKNFASGVTNERVWVPALDEQLVEVEVSSSLFEVIRQLQSLRQQERRAFDYEINGRVHLGDGMFSLPFRESGVIDLAPPPPRRPDRS